MFNSNTIKVKIFGKLVLIFKLVNAKHSHDKDACRSQDRINGEGCAVG